jgi:Uma2 family endonuclease
MEPVAYKETWTEDELLALKVEGKFELVDGELMVAATGFRHEIVLGRLWYALEHFVRERKQGTICGSGLGYWMKNGNLRSPDLSFISSARIGTMVPDPDKYVRGAPDLAVEILSPNDSFRQVRAKAREYSESGTLSVWIIDPIEQKVLVVGAGGQERLLATGDVLEDETVLSGFSMAVSELFAPV